jgi:rod shape determining protein RodA
MHKKYFYYGFALFLITLPITYHMLHPYQKKRIAVFLGEGNTKKERYQIEQSKIAIGSGCLVGKGYLQGTQNLLLFLPESQTDCIFSVICEELGFLGAMGIMLLYVALMLRSLFIIYSIKISFARLLAIGLLMPFIFSTFINIGMVTGLLPIVGIPLPLITYGITHTWITLASLGWIQGVAIRQYYLGD